MAGANLVVRFALELCLLGSLAWWGAETGGPALAIAAPVAAAGAWGAFVSPKARVALRPVGRAAVEAALFGGAALALADLGHAALAVALAVAALVSGTLERTLAPPAWAAGRSGR